MNPTACSGEVFYDWFPTLRQNVADRIAATTGSDVDHTAPGVVSLLPMVPKTTGATTMPFGLCSRTRDRLQVSDFDVSGTSPGWTIESLSGKASTYRAVVAPPGEGRPDEGTVSLTLSHSSVEDLGSNIGPEGEPKATVNYIHDDTAPQMVLYQEPHRTASNAAAFDWTVTWTEPVLGFTVSESRGGRRRGYVNWLLGQDADYEFMTKQPTPSNGTFTVSLLAGVATDLAGNPSEASAIITIKSDRSDPTTGTPKVSLRSGTTPNGGALRVAVGSAGTDTGPAEWVVRRPSKLRRQGVRADRLQGDRRLAPLEHDPGPHLPVRDPGPRQAGNIGDWKAGPTLKPALTQQTSGSINWSGVTKTTSYPSYSGGSQRYLGAAGASASYTTSARSLSFVTTRGPSRGSARIYVDGVLQATVNLNASTTTYQFVAFSKTWSSVGTHTIKVVSVGTPVARVDIDAFGVIRTRSGPALRGPGGERAMRRARLVIARNSRRCWPGWIWLVSSP